MTSPLSFPSPMHPEPLSWILTNHRFEGIVSKLCIGLYIFFDLSSMNQFEGLSHQYTMPLVSISNHKNRDNRNFGSHGQYSQRRSSGCLFSEEVNPYPFASLCPLINQNSYESILSKGLDNFSCCLFRWDDFKPCGPPVSP